MNTYKNNIIIYGQKLDNLKGKKLLWVYNEIRDDETSCPHSVELDFFMQDETCSLHQ